MGRTTRPAAALPLTYANDRATERRLKVGYVSPDFRGHSVAFFLEPLLKSHDRNEIEVFCYAEVSWPDAVTERFKRTGRSLGDDGRNVRRNRSRSASDTTASTSWSIWPATPQRTGFRCSRASRRRCR